MIRPWVARVALGLVSGALLGGCTVGPDYEVPATAAPERFGSEVDWVDFDAAAAPEIEWWRRLDDPILDGLIDRALAENLGLQASAARLAAARARLGLVRWDAAPEGDLTAQWTERAVGSEPTAQRYGVGLGASWEIDLFGRVRRSVEAASATFEERENEHRLVAVALAAEIGRTYFLLRGAQAGQGVARANIANAEDALEIIEAKRDAGRVADLEVAQTLDRLETLRAVLPDLESQEFTARHRLAVLVGAEPVDLYPLLEPVVAVPSAPRPLAIGDPGTLLARRPDVRAAERRLAAATATIGVAKADLFPRISLDASFDTVASDLDGLADRTASTTAFGPFLHWSPFDIGRNLRRVEANQAEAEALVADYRATVLRAIEDAETALVRLDRVRRRQVHRDRALEAARRAYQLARERYEVGLSDYQTVLDADDRRLVAQDAVIRGTTEVGLAYVGLYQALGGSWSAHP